MLTKSKVSSPKRSKLFTISTILVTAVVFTISSFFISLAIMSRRAVHYYEQKAQVIIFFDKEATEKEIFSVRDKLYDEELIESIEYVTQDRALEIYKEDFADNPDLISTITADALPPSLEIRAVNIDALLQVIDTVNQEKSTNVYIDDILYFKDVVDNMRTLSRIINLGGILIISSLILITFFLIRVTIGLNIKLHQEEIEIMHLVGGTESFIKTPFILEGALYGVIGGFVASTLILLPWYLIVFYSQNANYWYWVSQIINDFDLNFLGEFNLLFVLIHYLVHVGVGAILGIGSSYSAVNKYLKDK
ncbi:MAG: permease-like cell division protein FtsX [Candidatus Dojkabacteria bacterium]|jgi:cell division transport system permease protein|nr:permease-like cell division protein FtsX [Candidatus Dojkabacteria bacterium]MDD2270158.1 permease-like cell division protein FtsX [Candidatus Dojkabacteria bacterium]